MRTREVSAITRQKISQGVKNKAAQRSEAEKQAIRDKISAGQKRAWAAVPKKEEETGDEEPIIEIGSW